jgi:hypothetical protein
MRPEKLKNVYWKFHFIINVNQWYYQLSASKRMDNAENYPVTENSLMDCILKFKSKKRIRI